MKKNESFFFEVSPQRKKCLMEQVLPIRGNRSCTCCQKGTTGGYPAKYVYDDLTDGTWNRVDAYGDKDSMTPPTKSCFSK